MRIVMSPEIKDGTCFVRPRGECNLAEAVDLITRAIAYCRIRGLPKLFVDGTGLTGISIPTLVDRFLAAEEWAHEGKGAVAMVLFVEPKYIHPEKFGVQVATHFGLTSNVFPDENEGLTWLSGITH